MTRLRFLIFLMLLCGCRTGATERFVEPTPGRYDESAYPREVFDKSDYPPRTPTAVNQSTIPTSGFGSPSNGGMGPYKW